MKLRTLLALSALLATAITAMMAALIWRSAALSDQAGDQHQQALRAARQMSALLVLTHEYARMPSARQASEWRARHRDLEQEFQRLGAPADDRHQAALQDSATRLRSQFDQLASEAPDAADRAPRLDALLSGAQALADGIFGWARDKHRAQNEAARSFQRTTLLAVGVLAALLVGEGLLVAAKLLRPLGRLRELTDAIARGDLHQRAAVTGNDEMSQLARRIDAMATSLAARDAAVRQEIARREQSEQRIRTIADRLPGLVAYIDGDQRYQFVNDRFRAAFGKEPEDFIGHTMQEMLGDGLYASVRPHVEAALRGEAVKFERHTTELGRNDHHLVEYVPNLQPDGRIDGFFALVLDITSRKQAELAQARNEERMHGILRNAPDAYIAADAAGLVTEWNAQAERTFGWTREEALGHTLAALIKPENTRVAAVRAFGSRLEATTYDKHGQPVQVEMSVASIPDGQGHATITFLQDITGRKIAETALRELTDIFDNTPDFVVQTDWNGRIVYMNPAVRAALGFDAGHDIARHAFTEFYTPDTSELLLNEATPYAREHGVWLGETKAVLSDGRVLPISHMVLAHKDAHGRVSRYSSVMRDISQEVAVRDLAHRQTQTLSSVAEAIPAAISAVGPDEDYRFVNSGFERWRGKPRGDILGKRLRDVLGELEYAVSAPYIRRAMAGETVSFERDSLYGDAQRNQLVTYIPLRQPDGRVDGFVGVAQDITAHKQEEQRLLKLSESDPLTGLLNRQGFESYLEQRHQRADDGLALLYIDLDKFKPVNDTYGHPMGDALLRAFAERLATLVRPTDIVARLGGDEFAILLPGIRAKAHADAVADKVVAAAGTPFRIGQLELHIGASVGVAMMAEDGSDGLVRRADAAVYRAKAAGRGQRA